MDIFPKMSPTIGIPVGAEVNSLHNRARIHDAHSEVGKAVVARLGHGGAPLFLVVALRHPDQGSFQGDHLARIYVLEDRQVGSQRICVAYQGLLRMYRDRLKKGSQVA